MESGIKTNLCFMFLRTGSFEMLSPDSYVRYVPADRRLESFGRVRHPPSLFTAEGRFRIKVTP